MKKLPLIECMLIRFFAYQFVTEKLTDRKWDFKVQVKVMVQQHTIHKTLDKMAF